MLHYSKFRKYQNLTVLSLTDSQAPLVSDTDKGHGGTVDSGGPNRAGGETPARRTAPEHSTPPHEPIPTLRTAAGAPEKAPRRPWRPRARRRDTLRRLGSDRENERAYEQQDDTGKLNHKTNRREAHRSGLTMVRCLWRSSDRSQGRTCRAGRFRPTQVMQASRREALGQGDHAGLARHDGKGLTAATASSGAERWQSRAEKKRKDDGGGCDYL